MKLIFGRAIRFADPAPDYAGKTIPLPERLFVPLKQHSGPAALPTVAKGDALAEGQVIGSPREDFDDSAPVHSPVAGTVADVVSRPDYRGMPVQTIVIDAAQEPAPLPTEVEPLAAKVKLTKLLAAIKDAGVVPSGPSVPPLSMRLLPTQPKRYLFTTDVPLVRPIEELVLSGLDREPGIHVHRALAANPHPAMFVGVEAMLRLSGAGKVVMMGDKDFRASNWEPVLNREGAKLIRMDNSSYPNGLVQVQIKKATGREVPLPYGDPRDIGVVFARMETVYWAGLAIAAGIPQTAKYVTVVTPSGQRHLVKALIGTPIRHLMESLGLHAAAGGKIILGGRLTGHAIFDLDTPITKEIDGLVIMEPGQVRSFSNAACINCGICSRVCPTNLVPGQLSKYCEYDLYDQAEEQNLFHCIECGLCAYVCPAKRPMVHYFRHAKEELMAGRTDQ